MLDFLSALSQRLTPLWEMSVTAAYAAAVVIVLRLLLKKRAPKQVLCLLWLVVFARLLIPVSLESPLSIVPDTQQVQFAQGIPSQPAGGGQVSSTQGQTPAQNHEPAQNQPSAQNPGTVIPAASNPGVPALTAPEGMTPAAAQQGEKTGFPWQAVLAGVWLAVAAALTLYALVAYFRLRRCLFDAIRAKDGAWEHPAVNSPFILGVLRPKIYLPAGLAGQPRQFILCHERAHLRRLDHIVKPICWAALVIHWFNPMVWAAYILMSRDIEAACDEAVIRRLGSHVKADYSATLLSLATNGRVPAPCPLAFDEGDAKGRIKNVLNYRRPALWIVVVSVIAAVLAAACLLTDPVAAKEPEGDPSADPSFSADPSQPPSADLDPLLDPWMKEVLDGERTFRDFYREHNYGDSQDYTIHQLRSYFYGDDQLPKVTVELGKLTVIDLDKDGINEMVIWPIGEHEDPTDVGYYTGYLILRREGDQVYGHNPGWRAMGYLKADGTFDWSGSAFEWGTGSARFTESGFEIQQITWCDNSIDAEHYFVDGLAAEKDAFDRAIRLRQYQPDPIWYTYADGVLARVLPSIPLEYALSAPYPEDFLNANEEDGDQFLLYYQAYELYDRLFGRTNEAADFFPGQGVIEPAEQVERNGWTYTPASGLFARWDDFERAVLSVFTRDFWDSKNILDDNGNAIYINVDGRMYYLNYGRGGGNYNDNFPETFRLVEKTDDTVSFIMTGYYSNRYPLEGESYEERDARVAADWEYSIDFPMRMVKTENGWRFDEFHLAITDDDSEFYSQRVPKPSPSPSPEPSSEPSPSPSPEPSSEPSPSPSTAPVACEHGLEDIRLEYVGKQLTARCNQCDFTYPIPGVTSANWSGTTGQGDGNGWMKEDMDGDDHTELVVYTNDHQVVSLKMVEGVPVASSFDLRTLTDDFNQNNDYHMDIDNKIMEVSYQGKTKQAAMDDAFWGFALNRGGGYAPEIWLTEYWANRLTFGFPVYNARGYNLNITAHWTLSYSADGRLQISSFW